MLDSDGRSGPVQIRLPMTGRRREFFLLIEHVARIEVGDGQVLRIMGDTGVGKSRLVEELEVDLDKRSIAVWQARAPEGRNRAPLAPFLDLARAAADALVPPAAASRAAAFEAMRDAVAWTPEEATAMGEALAGVDASAHEDGSRSRSALTSAFTKLLIPADRTPRVIILEDFHRADAASRQLFERLVAAVPGHPLLVVAVEQPSAHEFPHGPHVHTLELAPLSAEEGRDLLDSVLDIETLPPRVADRLFERGGGNPFFLVQVLQAWVSAGHLRWQRGRLRYDGGDADPGIPDSVEYALKRRIAALEPHDQILLLNAAVLGDEFPKAILVAVHGALTQEEPDRLPRRVDRLTRLNLLEARRGEKLGFANALLAEIALKALDADRVRAVHAAAAVAWEAPEHAAELDPARVAEHWLAAGQPDRALSWLIAAAERCRRLFDHEQAAAIYRRAIGLTPKDDLRLAELQLELGDVLVIRGDFAAAQDALRAARDAGASGPRLLARMALVAARRGQYSEALTSAEAAAAGAREPVQAARAEGLASAICLDLGRLSDAERHVGLGLDRLGQHSAPETAARLYIARGDVTLARGLALDAAAEQFQALGLAEQAHDPWVTAAALRRLAASWAGGGRVEMATHYLQLAYEAAAALGDIAGLAEVCILRGQLAADRGEWDPALADATEAMALAAGIGDPLALARVGTLFGRVALGKGLLDEAERELGGALATAQEIGARLDMATIRVLLSEVKLRSGALPTALGLAEEAFDLASASGAGRQAAEALLALAAATAAGTHRENAEATYIDALFAVTELGDDALRWRVLDAIEALQRG